MATLNDRRLFDFERFLSEYSVIIWPLFVWNVWAYRYGRHATFSMLDFYHIVGIDRLNYYNPGQTLDALRRRVNAKIGRLQRQFPQGRGTYKPLRDELLSLGVTPETTYLYMRGHDLFDGIVAPLLSGVCEALRREREREIRRLADHAVQMQNELAAYQHAVSPVDVMLRRQAGYTASPLYERIRDDVRRFLQETGIPGAAPPKTSETTPANAQPRGRYRNTHPVHPLRRRNRRMRENRMTDCRQ